MWRGVAISRSSPRRLWPCWISACAGMSGGYCTDLLFKQPTCMTAEYVARCCHLPLAGGGARGWISACAGMSGGYCTDSLFKQPTCMTAEYVARRCHLPLVPAQAGTRCWISAGAGMSGGCCTGSIFKQPKPRQASSPVFFGRRVRRRCAVMSAAPKRNEGARDARGPDGPTGLDASRHRGWSSSFECRKSAKSQGVPRAVFRRFAPHRPRWTYLQGNRPRGAGFHLSTAVGSNDRPARLTMPA